MMTKGARGFIFIFVFEVRAEPDAAAAVESARLAANLMDVDRCVAESTESEAAAAQLLVAAERAMRQAAEETAQQLRQEVAALQGKLTLQEKGWAPRRGSSRQAGHD